MSILRKSAITALVAGAAVAVPGAAFAATTQDATAAPAAASAPTSAHRANCTDQTFNLYLDFGKDCYTGTGSYDHDTRGVYQVTTGKYWGCMLAGGDGLLFRSFSPGQAIRFDSLNGEVRSFSLSAKPVICPL